MATKKPATNTTKSKKTRGEKQHNWMQLKADFLESEHTTIASWARDHFGIKKGAILPWWIREKTKWWAEEKQRIEQIWFEWAVKELEEASKKKWIKTLQMASEAERLTVETIIDFAMSFAWLKQEDGRPLMTMWEQSHVLGHLRTVQWKATQILANEWYDDDPIGDRLKELGFTWPIHADEQADTKVSSAQ